MALLPVDFEELSAPIQFLPIQRKNETSKGLPTQSSRENTAPLSRALHEVCKSVDAGAAAQKSCVALQIQ